MSDIPELTNDYKPISRVIISKDEAQKCIIGDTGDFTVSGKITDIHECMDGSSKYYEVTIEQSHSSRQSKESSVDDMRKNMPVAER